MTFFVVKFISDSISRFKYHLIDNNVNAFSDKFFTFLHFFGASHYRCCYPSLVKKRALLSHNRLYSRRMNAIVVGAGPAGLGAALAFRRAGLDVTVLEKQVVIGGKRRGETIRFSEEVESLLYKGFFKGQAIHQINRRRYYSHSGKYYAEKTIENPNIIIHFTHFVKEIARLAETEGVKIQTDTEVRGFVFEGEHVRGVQTAAGVLGADVVALTTGHHTGLIKEAIPARKGVDIPIHKRIVSQYHGPESRLEYFLHVSETPGIGCIFPRGNNEAEILIMAFNDIATRPVALKDMNKYARNFEEQHNLFSDRLNPTNVDYQAITYIPMGQMLTNYNPYKNVITAGDSIGQVEARGGSGIRSSFLLSHALAQSYLKHYQSQNSSKRIFKEIEEHPEMKRLKIMQVKNGLPRKALMGFVKDPAMLDFAWPALKLFFS